MEADLRQLIARLAAQVGGPQSLITAQRNVLGARRAANQGRFEQGTQLRLVGARVDSASVAARLVACTSASAATATAAARFVVIEQHERNRVVRPMFHAVKRKLVAALVALARLATIKQLFRAGRQRRSTLKRARVSV